MRPASPRPRHTHAARERDPNLSGGVYVESTRANGIDLAPWAGRTLYFENRLTHPDGRGSDENIGKEGARHPPGSGGNGKQHDTAAPAGIFR